MPEKKPPFWVPHAVLAILVILAFANSLKNSFVFDDEKFIVKNGYLTSFNTLPQLLTQNIIAGSGYNSNLYRPLQSFTHLMDVQIWGLNPWGHHLGNLLFHTCLALALFVLLKDVFGIFPAFSGAALFALHPLQAESVAYLSGRGDTLGMLFLCLGLFAFKRNLGLSLLFATLAMMSKESMALFPVFLFLYQYLKGELGTRKRHIPFWLISMAYAFLRLTLLNFNNTLNFYNSGNLFTENFLLRLYTYLTTLPKGILLWIYPSDLHHERSWPVFTEFTAPGVFIGAALVILMAGLIFFLRNKSRAVSVGLAWFFTATIPTSNLFVIINAIFYDHWFLAPGLGLIIIFCRILSYFNQKTRETSLANIAAYCFLFFLIAGCLYLTPKYNKVWRDPFELYTHILKYEPKSTKSLNNLGMAYSDQGEFEKAISLYKKSIALSGAYPETHHNLGNAYLNTGKIEQAFNEFLAAVTIQPVFFPSWIELGNIYLRAGKLKEAQRAFEKAVKINPGLTEAAGAIQRLEKEIIEKERRLIPELNMF